MYYVYCYKLLMYWFLVVIILWEFVRFWFIKVDIIRDVVSGCLLSLCEILCCELSFRGCSV